VISSAAVDRISDDAASQASSAAARASSNNRPSRHRSPTHGSRGAAQRPRGVWIKIGIIGQRFRAFRPAFGNRRLEQCASRGTIIAETAPTPAGSRQMRGRFSKASAECRNPLTRFAGRHPSGAGQDPARWQRHGQISSPPVADGAEPHICHDQPLGPVTVDPANACRSSSSAKLSPLGYRPPAGRYSTADRLWNRLRPRGPHIAFARDRAIPKARGAGTAQDKARRSAVDLASRHDRLHQIHAARHRICVSLMSQDKKRSDAGQRLCRAGALASRPRVSASYAAALRFRCGLSKRFSGRTAPRGRARLAVGIFSSQATVFPKGPKRVFGQVSDATESGGWQYFFFAHG